VSQVLEDENKVDIFSVDYGDSEFVSYDDLVPMPIMLRHMPFQAIECTCLDIEPLDMEWSDDDCDKFFDLYYNRVFQAQVGRLDVCPVLHVRVLCLQCLL